MIEIHMDGLIYAGGMQGGIKRCFSNMLRCIEDRRDIHVNLYLPDFSNAPVEDSPSISLINYPTSEPVGRIKTRLNRVRLKRLWCQPDNGVYHSTYYSTHNELNIPQVQTIHDAIYELFPECYPVNHCKFHIADKERCIKTSSAIIFPSNSAMNDTKQFYDLEGKLLYVIPHAIEPMFRRIEDESLLGKFRDRYTDGWPFILCVGARWAHKNFSGLLAAYARWSGRSQFRLLAIGGGEALPHELSMIRGLGIQGCVHFCASFSDQELVMAYNAATAFVMPALNEGYGFPVMEAQACGTPVAASNGGSTPEVGGDAPFYFDPYNGDEIIHALDLAVDLSHDSDRVKEGIARARKRSWADVTEEHVQMYKRLAATA